MCGLCPSSSASSGIEAPSWIRSEAYEWLELAYAVTVHKSQGSQFKTTYVVIPDPCPLLSPELLYTALTRQQDKVVLLKQGEVSTLRDFATPRSASAYLAEINGQSGDLLAVEPEHLPCSGVSGPGVAASPTLLHRPAQQDVARVRAPATDPTPDPRPQRLGRRPAYIMPTTATAIPKASVGLTIGRSTLVTCGRRRSPIPHRAPLPGGLLAASRRFESCPGVLASPSPRERKDDQGNHDEPHHRHPQRGVQAHEIGAAARIRPGVVPAPPAAGIGGSALVRTVLGVRHEISSFATACQLAAEPAAPAATRPSR